MSIMNNKNMTDSELDSINEQVAKALGFVQREAFGVFGSKLCWFRTQQESNYIDLPDYSRSIEAAWEAVEFASKNGYRLEYLSQSELGNWKCSFLKEFFSVQSVKTTAPLAVCGAFLLLANNKVLTKS